jgi:hypothetical protein
MASKYKKGSKRHVLRLVGLSARVTTLIGQINAIHMMVIAIYETRNFKLLFECLAPSSFSDSITILRTFPIPLCGLRSRGQYGYPSMQIGEPPGIDERSPHKAYPRVA